MKTNEFVSLAKTVEELLEMKKQIEREDLSQEDLIEFSKILLVLYKFNFYDDVKRNISRDIEDLNTSVVMYDFFLNSFMNLLIIQDCEEKEGLLQALLNAQVAFDANEETYNKDKIGYEKLKSLLEQLNTKKLQKI